MSIILKTFIVVIALLAIGLIGFSLSQSESELNDSSNSPQANYGKAPSDTKIRKLSEVSSESPAKTKKSQTSKEKYRDTPILYVDFINGNRVEVLKVEEFNNGEVKKITQRWPSGTISVTTSGILDGTESGYNVDYRNGPYSSYDLETLKGLATSGNREAELVLADKLIYQRKRDEAIDHVFSAARKGYTAGFDKLSMSYLMEGDRITSYAYNLLAYENAPDVKKKEYDKIGSRLKPESLAQAKEIMTQIKKDFERYTPSP